MYVSLRRVRADKIIGLRRGSQMCNSKEVSLREELRVQSENDVLDMGRLEAEGEKERSHS